MNAIVSRQQGKQCSNCAVKSCRQHRGDSSATRLSIFYALCGLLALYTFWWRSKLFRCDPENYKEHNFNAFAELLSSWHFICVSHALMICSFLLNNSHDHCRCPYALCWSGCKTPRFHGFRYRFTTHFFVFYIKKPSQSSGRQNYTQALTECTLTQPGQQERLFQVMFLSLPRPEQNPKLY